MNALKTISPFILLVIWLSACEFDYFKDFSDPLPKIETQAISQPGNDTTEIQNRVQSTGETPLSFLGAAYAPKGTPFLDEPAFQVIADDAIGDLISVYFYRLEVGTTYWFRGFAVNEYGYTFSDTVVFQIPPRIAYEPPCELEAETIYYNGQTYAQTFDSEFIDSNDEYEVNVSFSPFLFSGAPNLRFDFKERPQNGIYFTADLISDREEQEVIVRLQKNDTISSIHYPPIGEPFYVEEDGIGGYTIQFCDLVFRGMGFEDSTVSVRLKVNN